MTPNQQKEMMKNRAVHVIRSCETKEQLETARKYINLLAKRYMLGDYLCKRLKDVYFEQKSTLDVVVYPSIWKGSTRYDVTV